MDKRKGPLAERMAHIKPFHVMALLARARELEAAGRSIVHMEIGEPDFTTPAPVIEAGRRALAEGLTHYTPATGLASLREAIADHYRDFYGVAVAPARIVVTPGASGALLLVLGVQAIALGLIGEIIVYLSASQRPSYRVANGEEEG